MTESDDKLCARAVMITMIVGVLALGMTACGNSNESSTATVDLSKLNSLAPPDGFQKLDRKPSLELAQKIAAEPLPPGFEVHPPRCSPMSASLTTEQLKGITAIAFQSSTSRIAVVAYDAGSSAPFDVPDDCRRFSITGPNQAGSITAPFIKIGQFSGADAVRASRSLIRENAEAKSYDSYLYTAQVKRNFRGVAWLSVSGLSPRWE